MYRLSFDIDKYNVSLLDLTLANNFHWRYVKCRSCRSGCGFLHGKYNEVVGHSVTG